MAIDLTTMFSYDLWSYYVDDTDENIIYITDYIGNETVVTVPSKLIVDGIEKKVKSTYYLFYKDENIVSIEFSDGIEIIGVCTCYQCLNLVNIKIPNTVTTLESYSFWNCSNVEEIELPESITSIENGSLCGLNNLKTLNLPTNLSEQTLSTPFIFKECPDLVISVDSSDKEGLDYLLNNGLNYKVIGEKIYKKSHSPNKYFLAGVANAEIFKGNDLFSTAKTLIDSSITIGVSAEDIRAGQGAKLYGKYFHTSTFDLKMTDAMFRLEYIAANVGSDLELGGDVFTEEEHVAVEGGKFTLANIPVPMIENEKVYVYYKKSVDDYYTVAEATKDSKEITIANVEAGAKYCIKYLYTNDAARKLVVKANFTPDTLSVYLTANLYSGDATNPQTATKAGTVTIKVPRFLLNGSQEISMSMTGASNTPFEGSALATKGDGCEGDGIYAEIIEIITGRTYGDIVDLKIQNSDDILILNVGEKYKLVTYGRFNDSYFSKLDNSKISFTSIQEDYVTIDDNGIITAIESVDMPIPVIAYLNVQEHVYDIINVLVQENIY